MASTKELNRLDEAHSLMVSLAEQGDTSVVLYTLASVLGSLPILDKAANDPHYWQQVIVNLNTLADTCQREECSEETLFGDLTPDDWDRADAFFDDDERAFDER